MSAWAIDLDGCLVDFNTGFAKLLHGINPTVKLDYMDDSFPACWGWPEHYGYSREDESKAWTEVKNCGYFWESLKPYPTAWSDIDFLNAHRKKHDIYFVTSRVGATAKQETEQWLEEHKYPRPTVIITRPDTKSDFCTAVNAVVLVEDKPETLTQQSPGVVTVLIKRPYNLSWQGKSEFGVAATSIREGLNGFV